MLRCGYFGPETDKVSVRLARAHAQFKQWCAHHKIECSQPVFTERSAPHMKFGRSGPMFDRYKTSAFLALSY